MTRPDAVLANLDRELDWLRETYRHLHQHPELSLAEHETSRLVAERLAAFGYAMIRIGGTGRASLPTATAPRSWRAPTWTRSPVTEATGLPYASEVDGVPACGRDMYVTALLGAAKLMAGGRAARSGTYVALFQLAEEVAAGSRPW